MDGVGRPIRNIFRLTMFLLVHHREFLKDLWMKHVVIFGRHPKLGCVKNCACTENWARGNIAVLSIYIDNRNPTCVRGPKLADLGKFDSDKAVIDGRICPVKVGRLLQGAGNLGDRMARCFSRFGHDPVLIIGSDIPDVGQAHIAAAFDALRRNDVVFGPSNDGGYWLVGMRQGRLAGPLFDNVRLVNKVCIVRYSEKTLIWVFGLQC